MSALTTANPEQAKYQRLWAEHAAYRHAAPGEALSSLFLSMAEIKPHHTVVDFGCGTGRGAYAIAARTGAKVTALDFAEESLDEAVRLAIDVGDINLTFQQRDLTQPLRFERPADYGYCTDVLEHIPPEDVEVVLANIVSSARRVFLCISMVPDRMGVLIGEDLHLTVRPAEWWRELLEDKFKCRIIWRRTTEDAALFYVSAFVTFSEYESKGTLNVEDEVVRRNVHANLGLGLREIVPHPASDTEIMLLCGGPSLNDFEGEIVEQAKAGMPIVTVNGTYNWCIQRGRAPGLHIMVDARSFNKRFVERILPDCQYAISSQCDHELVASLPPERTMLWHKAGDEMHAILGAHDAARNIVREYYPVQGGATVALCALPMLAMLGFRRINVYGLDSCYRDRAHHAYEQPENDGESLMEILVDGRSFVCAPWMAMQAHYFQEITRYILAPVGVELNVHGDGLIAAIIAAAAAKKEH